MNKNVEDSYNFHDGRGLQGFDVLYEKWVKNEVIFDKNDNLVVIYKYGHAYTQLIDFINDLEENIIKIVNNTKLKLSKSWRGWGSYFPEADWERERIYSPNNNLFIKNQWDGVSLKYNRNSTSNGNRFEILMTINLQPDLSDDLSYVIDGMKGNIIIDIEIKFSPQIFSVFFFGDSFKKWNSLFKIEQFTRLFIDEKYSEFYNFDEYRPEVTLYKCSEQLGIWSSIYTKIPIYKEYDVDRDFEISLDQKKSTKLKSKIKEILFQKIHFAPSFNAHFSQIPMSLTKKEFEYIKHELSLRSNPENLKTKLKEIKNIVKKNIVDYNSFFQNVNK